jgi:hypothetical protein
MAEREAQITKIPQSLGLSHVANTLCNYSLQVYVTSDISTIRKQSAVKRYTARKPRQIPDRAESCTTWRQIVNLKLRSP